MFTALAAANEVSSVSHVRTIGRLLQLVGLGVPPLSIIMQLTGAVSLGQMLMMLLGSVCCFGIGRILEGYAG